MAEIEQQSTAPEPGVESTAPAPESPAGTGEAESWDVDELSSMGSLADPADDDPEPGADASDDAVSSGSSTSDEDEDQEADESEDDEEGEDGGDGQPSAQGDPWAVGGQMFEFAQRVASAPQRINEVPGKHRGEVLQKVLEAAYQRGRMDTQQQFASLEQEREFVDKYEQLRAEDPNAFFEWADQNPDDASRYWSARSRSATQRTQQPSRGGPSAPEQQQSQQQAMDPQVLRDAQRELSRLGEITDEGARSALIERIKSKEFLMTPGGVSALREAIDAAKSAPVPTDAKPDKARSTAERRQKAAANRANAARVTTGGNASAGNPNPIADINDPEELFELAMSGDR